MSAVCGSFGLCPFGPKADGDGVLVQSRPLKGGDAITLRPQETTLDKAPRMGFVSFKRISLEMLPKKKNGPYFS